MTLEKESEIGVMMNNMEKLCKGCLTYDKCIGYKIKDITCPCINCLVKMMCMYSCDKYKNRTWHESIKETS
jgi:hypothetical protein